jgi:UbiD family decarboxylase
VDQAPVHECIDEGDAVNVLKFPVPRFNYRDGGRYVGTMHAVITKDLNSDWVNLGLYRVMVHNERELGIYFLPGRQHIGKQYLDYAEQDKPMPVAIAIGLDPRLAFIASGNVPAGVCEYDIAGSMKGGPIEVVKGKTVDLPVPAKAEIVIEGLHRSQGVSRGRPIRRISGLLRRSAGTGAAGAGDRRHASRGPGFPGLHRGPPDQRIARHVERQELGHHLERARA